MTLNRARDGHGPAGLLDSLWQWRARRAQRARAALVLQRETFSRELGRRKATAAELDRARLTLEEHMTQLRRRGDSLLEWRLCREALQKTERADSEATFSAAQASAQFDKLLRCESDLLRSLHVLEQKRAWLRASAFALGRRF